MYTIKFDSAFVADYKRVMRCHPELKREFNVMMRELAEHGELSGSYGAHALNNPGGNYNGHIDVHLSDGADAVIVLYLPHKSNPTIRFVRMGSHAELFQGARK